MPGAGRCPRNYYKISLNEEGSTSTMSLAYMLKAGTNTLYENNKDNNFIKLGGIKINNIGRIIIIGIYWIICVDDK